MTKAKGRPSGFTKKIADTICEKIATTPRGLDFICANDEVLPSARTVHSWLNTHPDFLQSYLRARERQAALLMDECLEIADDTTNDTVITETGERPDSEWISRSKLRVDTRMRMAGKLDPKKWGDKSELKLSGSLAVHEMTEEEIAAELAALKAVIPAG